MKKINEILREKVCSNCGHPSDWHRFDDAQQCDVTDSQAKFRCIGYDCEVPGTQPKNHCTCPNFQNWRGRHDSKCRTIY
jgi:hypothetical protein